MLKTRTILEKIKELKGFKNDYTLAKDMDINLDNLRAWVRHNTIKKELIEYVIKNGFSLDEVFNNKDSI